MNRDRQLTNLVYRSGRIAYRSGRAVYRSLELPAAMVAATRSAARHRDAFNGIETYCMFLGYPRSGHSFVGSLLDAHPNIVIAHELDALHYLKWGMSRNQLYALILGKDERFTKSGREWTGYQYVVPNQWQGRSDNIKVIGDKKGSASSRRLRKDPRLLAKLRKTVNVDLRFIHVIRNPFDIISTTYNKGGLTLSQCVDYFFFFADANLEIKKWLDNAEVYELRHEQVIEDPHTNLSALCEFLNVDHTHEYLNDCASIVFDKPRKTRHSVNWTSELVDSVTDGMSKFDFLAGYSFET